MSTLHEAASKLEGRIFGLENRITQVASINDGRARKTETRLARIEQAIGENTLNRAPYIEPELGPEVVIVADRDTLLRGLHGIRHALSGIGTCPARDNATAVVQLIEEALRV